jgi:EmrB/QacA subfamily drug resistance transporter
VAGDVHLDSATGRRLLAAAALGTGVTFFDSDAVNVALPAIGDALGGGIASLQWVTNAFLIVLGPLLLVGGAAGDRFGRRRMYLAGLAVFAAGTVAAASAPTMVVLLAARALQGAGAVLLVPVSLAIASTAFRDEDRGAAIGWWSGLTATSAVIGPVVGGALTSWLSWRAVFGADLVLIAVAAWLGWRHLVVVPEQGRAGRVDLLGAVLAVTALGGTVFTLIQGQLWGFDHPGVLIAAVLAAVAVPAFLFAERYRNDPLVPLGMFRDRRFGVGNVVTALVYFAFSGLLFLVVILLQEALAYSAASAGVAILPVTAALLVLSPLAGRAADSVEPRWIIATGALTAAVGLVLLGVLDVSDYARGLLPGLAVFGAGMALTVAPLTSTVLAGADERDEAVASGVNTAVARVGGTLAVAVLPLLAGLSLEASDAAIISAFQRATLIAAGCCAAGAAAAWAMVQRSATDDSTEG